MLFEFCFCFLHCQVSDVFSTLLLFFILCYCYSCLFFSLCSSNGIHQKHQNWHVHHWHTIGFTDESQETLWSTLCCLQYYQQYRFVCESLMVWGGISSEGSNDILSFVRYQNEILRPSGAVGPGFLLVKVNAQCHVSV